MALPRPIKPSLDSVTTIRPDGSRPMLHPADVSGKFTLGRRVFGVLLIVVYVLLPWIHINGHPAVFLDTINRSFHLFGVTFAAQDLWLGFFVITGAGFGLFYVAALFGRLWCGWACPYTVFLEHVFRRIERWVDGDGSRRRALDEQPWTTPKFVKRAIKHTLYLIAATAIAHVFLSYFVSLPQLWKWMRAAPGEHWFAFAVVVFLTGVLYFCFSWFREQFCIILCPYGRLQSALTDDNTLVVGYDRKRGEPRRAGKAVLDGGDCVDCFKCVQVCPTGIDIRNGLQLECIGCAACIDACNDVMRKIKRPEGLVRYDSLSGLNGKKTKWIRPRIIIYTFLMACGAAALLISLMRLTPITVNLTRLPGAPFYVTHEGIRNQFQLRVGNKERKPRQITVRLVDAPAGTVLTGPSEGSTVKPESEEKFIVTIAMPKERYTGPQNLKFQITTQPGDVMLSQSLEFTGPDAAAVHKSIQPNEAR